MASASLIIWAIAAASLHVCSEAGSFLHHKPDDHMSEEEVQLSMLAEVEGTFGEGTASSRLKQLEAALAPMYAALPKNEGGFLGHATVRYALHRMFVQRHGWSIKGLNDNGGHRNSTSSVGLLKEHVPAYIQDLFEQRLGGRGFGLHELGVLAATIEHLVHNEAVKRLGQAFRVQGVLPTSTMQEAQADEVLDTYMTTYILGEDLSNLSLSEAQELKQEIPELYSHWSETQEFVRGVRKAITLTDGSLEQKQSGSLDFSLVARVAERVGEQFGSFQDQECHQIKSRLIDMDQRGIGRVRLSDFHKPADDESWTFQESTAYLRELGALDESDANDPLVIITNYMSGPSNCIASSGFYSVCCMDVCESLLDRLERDIAAPEAPPARIAALVSKLSSSSVPAPGELSASLLARLHEIAMEHGGSVPLHGRLFAQWMHHVFPRDCSFPHVTGTTNPMTVDEFEAIMGKESTVATAEEIEINAAKAASAAATRTELGSSTSGVKVDSPVLPWHPEEELLVVRPQLHGQLDSNSSSNRLFSILRSSILFAALASVVYSVVRTSSMAGSGSDVGGMAAEKYFV